MDKISTPMGIWLWDNLRKILTRRQILKLSSVFDFICEFKSLKIFCRKTKWHWCMNEIFYQSLMYLTIFLRMDEIKLSSFKSNVPSLYPDSIKILTVTNALLSGLAGNTHKSEASPKLLIISDSSFWTYSDWNFSPGGYWDGRFFSWGIMMR